MANLCQTARWGYCSDHSSSVALLVQTIGKYRVGSQRGSKMIFEVNGLSDSFKSSESPPPLCIDHGLTGTSTFFYKWAPNMLVKSLSLLSANLSPC